MKFTASDFPAKGNELTGAEMVRLCQLSEDVGFDRFGVTDFPFHHDCIPVMAACLQATDRIEVESLVTTPYARLPDATACIWASEPSTRCARSTPLARARCSARTSP